MAQEIDLAAVFSAAMDAEGVGSAAPAAAASGGLPPSSPSSPPSPSPSPRLASAKAAGRGRGAGAGGGRGAGRGAAAGRGAPGGGGRGGAAGGGGGYASAKVAPAQAKAKAKAKSQPSPSPPGGHVSASAVVDAFASSAARSPSSKPPGPSRPGNASPARPTPSSPESADEESSPRQGRPKFWLDPENAHPTAAARSPLRRNLSSPSSGSPSPSPSPSPSQSQSPSSSPRRKLLRREGTGGGTWRRPLEAESDLERARRAAMANVSERLLQLTRAQSAKYEWWDDRREAEFLAAEEKARRGNVQKSLDEIVERLYYQNLQKMQERADLNLEYWYNELPSPTTRTADEEGIHLANRQLYNEPRIVRRHARAALEERVREEEDEKLQLPEPRYFEKGERKEVVKRRWEKQQHAATQFEEWRKQERKEQRKEEKEYLQDNSVHRDVESTIDELFARTDRLYADHAKREEALERTRKMEAKEDDELAAELSLHKALTPDKARDRELVHWLHYHDQEARRRRSLRRKHLQEQEEEVEYQRIASASVHRQAQAREWTPQAVDDLSERLFLGRDPRMVRVGPWKHRARSWAPPKSAAASRITRQAARQAEERVIRERHRLEAYQKAKEAWHVPKRRGGGWDMALEQMPFEEVLREGWSQEPWPQPKRTSDFSRSTTQSGPAWRSPGIPNSTGESIARRRESRATSREQAKLGEEMLQHVAHLSSRERHRAWQPGANGYLDRVAALQPRSDMSASDWDSSVEGAIDEEMGGILVVNTSSQAKEDFRRATSAVVARAAAMKAWKEGPVETASRSGLPGKQQQ